MMNPADIVDAQHDRDLDWEFQEIPQWVFLFLGMILGDICAN